jgi:integrase
MVIKLLRPIEAKGSLETVKRLSQRLNEIMTYGVNSGLIFANPSAAFGRYSRNPRKRTWLRYTRRASELMMEIANASIKRTTRCLIEWQLHTMTRPAEAATTRWADIDFDKAHLDHPAGAHEEASPAQHPVDRSGTRTAGDTQAHSGHSTCSRQIEIRAPTPIARPPTWR